MSHFLALSPIFFCTLRDFDAELAREILAQGCPHCGHDRLHQANYPRKPRGIDPDHREYFSFRFSFCCPACRKRVTAPTLRFLGRKIYIGLVVVLASACEGRITVWFSRVAAQMGIPLRTLWRWRTFWTKAFPRSSFWREAAARFMPPLETTRLPGSLLEAWLGGREGHAYLEVLRFLTPITTEPGITLHEGR